ncbi:alpha/beta hydrolase [Streptomyces sp. NBC_00452]|uniref:alpha/beta hydrolase n=1 Tax=Streptomyces sp. NBC_00452 TaxID=2975746 RepID=UPI00338FAD18
MTRINKITVRNPDPLGSRLLWEPLIEPGSPRSLGQSRFIILIHGFQNSESKASASYEKFRRALGVAIWPRCVDILGSFWEYHWPGDHPARLISVATYSARVPDAKESGLLLYEFLKDLPGTTEVVLIGHSLGCRVALQAMRFIRRDGAAYRGARVRKAFLLAAAVPVDLCMARRDYDWEPGESHEYVFWSRNDGALGRVFNAGQKVYGEVGNAVGHTGLPPGRWTKAVPTELNHGDYWGSSDVAQDIAWFFGQRTRHVLPRWPRNTSRPLNRRELDRMLLGARDLPSHGC